MLRELLLMAVVVTHPFVSAIADDPVAVAAGEVVPSNWNAAHTVTGLASVATTNSYGDLTGTPTIVTLSQIYPVGSVYIETLGVNPNTTFGFGTWVAKGGGKVLMGFQTGSADFGTTGQTGGATGLSYTPSGTNAVVQFTPSGTNAISLFREAVSGTNAASVATGANSVTWSSGVPTFAGTTATVSIAVTWPTGKPAVAMSPHRHELPIIHTEATVLRLLVTSKFGVGQSTSPDAVMAAGTLIANTTTSGVVMLSNTVTSTGSVAWPASVPTAIGTAIPAGIISWPVSVPSVVMTTGTAAAQVFTGVTGSVSGQVFTGVTGTISGQVFNGIGATLDKLSPYLVVFFWERTA